MIFLNNKMLFGGSHWNKGNDIAEKICKAYLGLFRRAIVFFSAKIAI